MSFSSTGKFAFVSALESTAFSLLGRGVLCSEEEVGEASTGSSSLPDS